MRKRQIGAVIGCAGVVASLALVVPSANATSPPARFTPVALSVTEQNELADQVTQIKGLALGEAVAPTTIETSLGATETVKPAGHDDAEIAEIIAEEVPLSDKAQEQVEELVSGMEGTYGGTAEEIAHGLSAEPTTIVAASAEPYDVEVTRDTVRDEYIVKVTTYVTQTNDDGVVTEGLEESYVIVDPKTDEIKSIVFPTEEDFADTASRDSFAEPLAEGLAPDEGKEASTDPEDASEEPEVEVIRSAGGGSVANASTGIIGLPAMGISASKKKNVVNYALKYALKPNTAYKLFSADCTNFVSQSLRQGGWKDKGGSHRSNKNWFYTNRNNISFTWSGAANFFNFARVESKRVTKLNKVAYLVPGDVVQVKYKGKTSIGHSMVVTQRTAAGKIYVSYHSTNRKNVALSWFMNQYSGENYYPHRT